LGENPKKYRENIRVWPREPSNFQAHQV